MLDKIICGFQTGADIAGVVAAKRVGITTGGEMPKGFRTEKGNRPDFSKMYNATENSSRSYIPRTRQNAMNADATIILSPIAKSSGTKQTIKFCIEFNKPYVVINPFQDNEQIAIDFLIQYKPSILNIAGNRESVVKGLSKRAAGYLQKVFLETLRTVHPKK